MPNPIMVVAVDSNKNPQLVLTDKGTKISVREVRALINEERIVNCIDSIGVIIGVKTSVGGIILPQSMKEFDV